MVPIALSTAASRVRLSPAIWQTSSVDMMKSRSFVLCAKIQPTLRSLHAWCSPLFGCFHDKVTAIRVNRQAFRSRHPGVARSALHQRAPWSNRGKHTLERDLTRTGHSIDRMLQKGDAHPNFSARKSASCSSDVSRSSCRLSALASCRLMTERHSEANHTLQHRAPSRFMEPVLPHDAGLLTQPARATRQSRSAGDGTSCAQFRHIAALLAKHTEDPSIQKDTVDTCMPLVAA